MLHFVRSSFDKNVYSQFTFLFQWLSPLLGISQVNHLDIDFLLSKHCWMAAAGVCSLFCQGSYNLMTSAHKLLSVLQQNLMSELSK